MGENRHNNFFFPQMEKLQIKKTRPPFTVTVPLRSLNTHDNISAPTFTGKSWWGDVLEQPNIESNFFYISIHGNDIDLGSAIQWTQTADPGCDAKHRDIPTALGRRDN